jgi:hypothetical protein
MELARLGGQTSNSLLATLAEWNIYLDNACASLSAIKRHKSLPRFI